MEGPARRRADDRKKVKMTLMNQPHNKTDQVAYSKGDILKELHEEERAGRIGKALKYYKMVSAGRLNAMTTVIEEDKAMLKKAKEEEEKKVRSARRAKRRSPENTQTHLCDLASLVTSLAARRSSWSAGTRGS